MKAERCNKMLLLMEVSLSMKHDSCYFPTYSLVHWYDITGTCLSHSRLDPRSGQTLVAKTGSDNSTAKRSATDVSITVPRR